MSNTTTTRAFAIKCPGKICKTRQTADFTRGMNLGDQTEWYATCKSCGGDLIHLTLTPSEPTPVPALVEYFISVAATSTVERNVQGNVVVTMTFADYGTSALAFRELTRQLLDATIATRGLRVKVTLDD